MYLYIEVAKRILPFSLQSLFVGKFCIGVPEKYRGSADKRKPIAKKNGYLIGYKGTSKQNLALIKKAKNGKLKKA